MSKLNIKPLHDLIIAEAIEPEETSASGLVIPDSAKEKPQQATVLAVGDGIYDLNGKLVPVAVKAGDLVMHHLHTGTRIKDGERELIVFRPSDLIAVVTG